jgi:hypothetical protein
LSPLPKGRIKDHKRSNRGGRQCARGERIIKVILAVVGFPRRRSPTEDYWQVNRLKMINEMGKKKKEKTRQEVVVFSLKS